MDSDVQFLEEVNYTLESEEEEGGDESDDHFDLDEDVDGKAPTTKTSRTKCPKLYTEASGYDVLSPDQISVYMDDVVKEVNQVIQQPSTTTRLLLSQFNWDKEKLIEKYYEDTEKLFESCHVMKLAENNRGRRSKSPAVECGICFAATRSLDFKGTDCGHRFCSDCWNEYLTNKIIHENVTDKIECPAHKCKILLDDGFIMDMIRNEPTVKSKYLRGTTDSFVLTHRSIRWCPRTDCLFALKVEAPEWMGVTCTKCTTAFCFLCSEPWHDPIPCKMLKQWQKKCLDDNETCNWIVANTKDCPKCSSAIEKNGGCNHMHCKKCNTDFCWLCLSSIKNHQACNRFVEGGQDGKVVNARAALERYLFYYNRFRNHEKSLSLEAKLRATVEIKTDLLRGFDLSHIELQFLRKAVDTLKHCRQTLMYTYAFAFYAKKNHQQAIFEDNQSDLETATETLSKYLEDDFTEEETVADIKQRFQDQANYCESRRKVLVEHVHEGYEKEWWEFS